MGNESWPEAQLGDLISIKHGWPFVGEKFSETATHRPVVVNIGNFRYTGGFRFQETTVRHYTGDFPAEYILTPGDILLVMTCQTPEGEILGIPGRIPNDGQTYLHNQRLGKVVITDPARVDQDFLYWLFLSPLFNRHLVITASGTKILHTSPGRIEDFRFLLPSFGEQRAIASILGALDDKIELNRRMNATLEAMTRTLFRSWFVDFDPVRSKAEGRQPVGMDAETAALFPNELDDSPLGQIPRGWQVSTIGEAVSVVGGSTPSTQEPTFWQNGSICWATPKDLARLESSALLDTERLITEEGLRQISSGLLPKGTVLLSSRAPIGYLAIAEMPVAVNQGFIAMVCDRQLPNHYVLRWTEANMEAVKSRANGTTFMEVSKANFRPLLTIVPSAAVLELFSSIADSIHRRVVHNVVESQVLAATRDALLPKLLSGEVRVA